MNRSIGVLVIFMVVALFAVATGQDKQTQIEDPLRYVQETTLSILATETAIVPLDGRRLVSIYLLSSGTAWVSVGTTTAVVGRGLPIYSECQMKIDAGMAVPVTITHAANATATVHQGY